MGFLDNMFNKNTGTTTLNPAIELEQTLSSQIHNALHGDLVNKIISMSSFDNSSDKIRSTMEGHCFKVEKKTHGTSP